MCVKVIIIQIQWLRYLICVLGSSKWCIWNVNMEFGTCLVHGLYMYFVFCICCVLDIVFILIFYFNTVLSVSISSRDEYCFSMLSNSFSFEDK